MLVQMSPCREIFKKQTAFFLHVYDVLFCVVMMLKRKTDFSVFFSLTVFLVIYLLHLFSFFVSCHYIGENIQWNAQ